MCLVWLPWYWLEIRGTREENSCKALESTRQKGGELFKYALIQKKKVYLKQTDREDWEFILYPVLTEISRWNFGTDVSMIVLENHADWDSFHPYPSHNTTRSLSSLYLNFTNCFNWWMSDQSVRHETVCMNKRLKCCKIRSAGVKITCKYF